MLEINDRNKRFNPNPITKLLVLLFLSFTITVVKADWVTLSIVSIFSLLYLLMGKYKQGIRNFAYYFILSVFLDFWDMQNIPPILYMFITLGFILKIFYLPLMAGAFLVRTSDLGSIVSSMDKLGVPKALSIPIATMFRFGPSFKEEYNNIRFAMKMRGLSLKNPLLAMEYVYVPLLSISSEIAEDIAKYTETKALSDPCKKIRLTEVTFGLVDFLFMLSIAGLLVVDRL